MYYRCASPLVKVLVAPALAVLLVLAAAAVASVLAVLLALFSELVVPEGEVIRYYGDASENQREGELKLSN